MATKGHENEAIKVEGLSASLQKFKDDLIGIPNQSDVVYYTQAEADAYNALLTGALNSTDPLTAEEAAAYNEAVPLKVADNTLSEAESVAYNAQLTGALDSITPLTAEQAAAYTEAFPDDPMEEGNILTDDEAEAYNAQLTDALDHTTPLTAEQAVAFNTAFPAKEAGDTLLAFQASAYNATLDGAIKAGDVKTPAVPKKVKDYVDAGLDGKVDKETGKGLSTNDYTTDDKTTLDGLSVLSPVIRANRNTGNTAQWTMFASVNYPSVSRYDDIVLLVQGLGYYYTGQDTGCWIVECRTRYNGGTNPNTIGMTITELSPTGIPWTGTVTGTVQFGYYTDTTEGKTYFGVYTSTRHHYIETIKLGGQNIEHLETRIVLSEAPAGWSTLAREGVETRKCLSEQDFSMSYAQAVPTGTIYSLKVGGQTFDIADTNTIYQSGTKALYDTGTDTIDRVWTPKVLKSIGDTKQNKVAKLGSTTKPVYTSAAGTFEACSTYAGGTKVTLNGASYAGKAATFYAPADAGDYEDYVLKSNGDGQAPTWVDVNNLTRSIYISSKTSGLVEIDASEASINIIRMNDNVSGFTITNAKPGLNIWAICDNTTSTQKTITVSKHVSGTYPYYKPYNGQLTMVVEVAGSGNRIINFVASGTKSKIVFYVNWW